MGALMGGMTARPLVRLGVIALSFALAFALAELVVRIAPFKPATQMIHLDTLRVVDGVPVWTWAKDRQHTECATQHPERTRILILGDSIAYGFGLNEHDFLPPGSQDQRSPGVPDGTFSALLGKRLNAKSSPGFCIMNFAQSANGFEQSAATAHEEILRWHPALVLWKLRERRGNTRCSEILPTTFRTTSSRGRLSRAVVRPRRD